MRKPRMPKVPRVFFALLVSACIFLIVSIYRAQPGEFRIHVAERSFLSSLDTFLARGLYSRSRLSIPWDGSHEDLDKAMERTRGSVQVLGFPLRVYVYDMPEKFTVDLLRLFRDTYRETANLTSNGSPVHRLVEQHSIDYWLYADLLASESDRVLKTVVRVLDPVEADVFYVPFFTTISYFLMEKQACKQLYRVCVLLLLGWCSYVCLLTFDMLQEALSWVTQQPAWRRSGGRDHVLPVHHPWSFKSVRRFMKTSIWLLPDLDSTGNWYKPGEVSLEKDIVLPYVPNVEVCDARCMQESWERRSTLLFFRGRTKRNAGGKIRSKLASILQDEAHVVVEEGTIGEAGRQASQDGMRSSVFCLSPAGDTPSSARLFDAIVSGCIPVIVSDELEPPFEGLVDYRKVAIFVPSRKTLEAGWLVSYLRGITNKELDLFRSNMLEFSKHFQYSSPALPLGPEDLTWQTVAGKLQTIRLHIRRAQRMVDGGRNICACDCKYGNSTSKTF